MRAVKFFGGWDCHSLQWLFVGIFSFIVSLQKGDVLLPVVDQHGRTTSFCTIVSIWFFMSIVSYLISIVCLVCL